MDIGDCQKIHDVALRADYEKSKTGGGKDLFYDLDVSIVSRYIPTGPVFVHKAVCF